MKIIDAHLHLFPQEDWAEQTAQGVGHHNSVDHLRQVYGQLGMVHGVVMGNHSLETGKHDYPADLFHYCVGLDSLVLPAVTVGFGLAALITRTTRSSMLDVLRQDYMTTARAKGCSEKQVITVHGLKNALIPIITAIGLQMSLVITGSVLAETVFSWPGIGRLVYDSISKRDTPMVTGAIIMCSILMCIINLVVDLIYAFFDPRIKAQYSKKG